jgi:hypothetical protein
MHAAELFRSSPQDGNNEQARAGRLSSSQHECVSLMQYMLMNIFHCLFDMMMLQFYRSRPLLAVMVAPLLRHITERLRSKHTPAAHDTASTATDTTRHRGMDILVLSGHDVTVAALLYALQSHVTHSPGYWPAYSR